MLAATLVLLLVLLHFPCTNILDMQAHILCCIVLCIVLYCIVWCCGGGWCTWVMQLEVLLSIIAPDAPSTL